VQQTNRLCTECGIRIQRRGKKRHLVGVRLKSASQQPEPMITDGESNMTIATAIAALEALTADALPSADDAQLARLEELSGELEALIYDERERRSPADTGLEA
jgi:hypothetical protein